MKNDLPKLTDYEKSQIAQEVEEDKSGYGILHKGKYYIVTYHPLKNDMFGKCNGVKINLGKIDNDKPFYLPGTEVPFRQSWLSQKEPFKDRLEKVSKIMIDTCNKLDKQIDDAISKEAKEKADREKAIADHIKHVKSCQLKIDATIKTLVPEAKSMIECNNEIKRLEAAKEEYFKQSIDNIQVEDNEFVPATPKAAKAPIQYNTTHDNYLNEQEFQNHVNDMALRRKTNVPHPEEKSIPKIKFDPIVDYIKQKEESIIVEAELISQDDPRYFNFENQQDGENYINF